MSRGLIWAALSFAVATSAFSKEDGWKRLGDFVAPTPRAAVFAAIIDDGDAERLNFQGVICLASGKDRPLSKSEIEFIASLSDPVPVSDKCAIKEGRVIEPEGKKFSILIYADIKSQLSKNQFLIPGGSYTGPLNAFESIYRVTQRGTLWRVERSWAISVS